MPSFSPDRFARWWSAEDLRELPLLLRTAQRECDQAILAAMEVAGWPRLSMSALLTLGHVGPRGTPPGRLAGALGVSRQAVAQILTDLGRHDLVAVRPAWDVGRLVHLTDRGAEARAAVDAAIDGVLADIGDALPDDLTARMVFGLRLLAARDGEEWLRLMAVATSLGLTSADRQQTHRDRTRLT